MAGNKQAVSAYNPLPPTQLLGRNCCPVDGRGRSTCPERLGYGTALKGSVMLQQGVVSENQLTQLFGKGPENPLTSLNASLLAQRFGALTQNTGAMLWEIRKDMRFLPIVPTHR